MAWHPDPDVLVSHAGRELGPAAARELEAHLATCAECSAEVAKLRSFDALMHRAASSEGDAIDRGLEDVIRRRVAPPATAFRRWRGWIVAASSIAAALLLWIGLRPAGETSGPFGRGSVVYESQPSGIRGAPGDTFHFDLRVDRPTHLVIVQTAGGNATIVYPHPNPVFGAFGRTTPFAAGEAIRIPPSAVADYPAPASRPEPVYLAAPTPDVLAGPALDALLADLRAAAPSGADAVRARLIARFGSAIELPRR